MGNIDKISVALPPEMVILVRQAVEDGDYASNSEVIRDALRDWTLKRSLRQQGVNELRRMWQEAIGARGAGVPAEDVLSRLERKYRAMVDGQSATE